MVIEAAWEKLEAARSLRRQGDRDCCSADVRSCCDRRGYLTRICSNRLLLAEGPREGRGSRQHQSESRVKEDECCPSVGVHTI